MTMLRVAGRKAGMPGEFPIKKRRAGRNPETGNRIIATAIIQEFNGIPAEGSNEIPAKESNGIPAKRSNVIPAKRSNVIPAEGSNEIPAKA